MKQIKKLSLSNVISKLTRNEMRNVMAGSGDESGYLWSECKVTFTTGGTTYVYTNNYGGSTYSAISSAANSVCLEYISHGATKCTYDCDYDGYGN